MPRCKGTNRHGTPCMMEVAEGVELCSYHNGVVYGRWPRCGYIKRNGEPCRQLVAVKGERCMVHTPEAVAREDERIRRTKERKAKG